MPLRSKCPMGWSWFWLFLGCGGLPDCRVWPFHQGQAVIVRTLGLVQAAESRAAGFFSLYPDWCPLRPWVLNIWDGPIVGGRGLIWWPEIEPYASWFLGHTWACSGLIPGFVLSYYLVSGNLTCAGERQAPCIVPLAPSFLVVFECRSSPYRVLSLVLSCFSLTSSLVCT